MLNNSDKNEITANHIHKKSAPGIANLIFFAEKHNCCLDLRGDIYFILKYSKTKCWLVLIRKGNIQNFECIHRGLEVAFINDRCFQMSLSFIKILCVTMNFKQCPLIYHLCCFVSQKGHHSYYRMCPSSVKDGFPSF